MRLDPQTMAPVRLAHYEKAKQIFDTFDQRADLETLFLYGSGVMLYGLMGEPSQARRYFDQMMELAFRLERFGELRWYADYWLNYGEPQYAEQAYQALLNVTKKATNTPFLTNFDRMQVLCSISEAAAARGDHQQAKEYLLERFQCADLFFQEVEEKKRRAEQRKAEIVKLEKKILDLRDDYDQIKEHTIVVGKNGADAPRLRSLLQDKRVELNAAGQEHGLLKAQMIIVGDECDHPLKLAKVHLSSHHAQWTLFKYDGYSYDNFILQTNLTHAHKALECYQQVEEALKNKRPSGESLADKGLAIVKENPGVFLEQAALLQLVGGRNAQAQAICDMIINTSERSDPHLALAYFIRAKINMKERLFEKASDDCREAIQLRFASHNQEIYLIYGESLMRAERWSDAIKAFSTLESVGPKSYFPALSLGRGVCYYKQGLYDQAKRDLDQVIAAPNARLEFKEKAEGFLNKIVKALGADEEKNSSLSIPKA